MPLEKIGIDLALARFWELSDRQPFFYICLYTCYFLLLSGSCVLFILFLCGPVHLLSELKTVC